jgi:ABC-type enterochelin transport system permease subunit
MAQSSFGVGRLIGGILGTIILLIIEVLAAMVVYAYLDLNHRETFGWLARLSKSLLDVMAAQLDVWFKGASNTAYATIFGELGPKAVLLLLIGLVVAAVFRGVIWLVKGLAGRWD